MLYQSTCVGLGYGLYAGVVSWKSSSCTGNPVSPHKTKAFVTPSRRRNINLLPIGYGCRPRLRGRLTLRGLALRRNPWTYGGRVSHTPSRYSCQHSRFRYLQQLSRATFAGLRNAPLPRQGTDDRCQMSEGGSSPLQAAAATPQSMQHACDFLILGTPLLPRRLIDVAEIQAVSRPDPHLIGRRDRHRHEPFELRRRDAVLGKSLRDVRADRFAATPDLIG